ncbi:hypothetical protein [Roseivivax isoporae]|uniref:DnaA N-terminal domain-containing protein n=1 Tax=Roseivivax isoporae LMG 25204 TaxID=1449351 RepID=X7FDT8_9RHOB|nr:hypothetical protein [Roseivivax isoporae]ETX30251.1 hypothetical protein RISW2_15565 [Roseivivax isoporae LMG 25204]
MDPKRMTGPQAGVMKYDLLTAMAVAGLSGSPGFQTSMMRLIALVTARYNWRNDELTVGQREMARMWSVDERTVKREVKRLTAARILLQLRPGVRGRVAAYRLNQMEIQRLSAPLWDRVGPDFSARMEAQAPMETPPDAKVVRLDFGAKSGGTEEGGATPWDRTRDRLALSDPALFRNWYAGLVFHALEGPVLHLRAPSGFVAQYVKTHHLRPLLDAVRIDMPGVHRVEIGG